MFTQKTTLVEILKLTAALETLIRPMECKDGAGPGTSHSAISFFNGLLVRPLGFGRVVARSTTGKPVPLPFVFFAVLGLGLQQMLAENQMADMTT